MKKGKVEFLINLFFVKLTKFCTALKDTLDFSEVGIEFYENSSLILVAVAKVVSYPYFKTLIKYLLELIKSMFR